MSLSIHLVKEILFAFSFLMMMGKDAMTIYV